MNSNFIFFTLMLFCGLIVGAQETENLAEPDLTETISAIFQSQVSLSEVDTKLKHTDPNQALALLKNHIHGEQAAKAVKYINRMSYLHPQTDVRRQVVDVLTKNIVNPKVGSRCYEFLIKEYQSDDYSESSRDYIRQLLQNEYSHNRQVIRLCGMANMLEQIPRLNDLIVEDENHRDLLKLVEFPWAFTKAWNAHLALARMGVQDEIDWCVTKIKDEIDNNPAYPISLFDDLGYIRQPESVGLLKDYFLSDRKINPIYGAPESFSHYLLPIISENVIGFPEPKAMQYNSRSFTQEEIETCKEWVRNQMMFSIRK